MPYTVGHPVQSPADFYGRQRQITQLFEIIGGAHPQSANIIGLPRSGKTSFLRHIAHPTVMVRYVRHPERMVRVYVDMTSCKTLGQFYYRILTQLKMSLGQVHTGFLWKESPPEQTSIYDVEAPCWSVVFPVGAVGVPTAPPPAPARSSGCCGRLSAR